MPPFDPAEFVAVVAAIGVVIIVATLISGLADRRALPSVGIFLLLGLAVGPAGLALLDIGLDSAALGAIATISLTLVLFTDALGLDRAELVRNARLAVLILVPGTLTAALIIAGAAIWLLDLSPALAAILAASLASTDPVMMRSLLRRPGVPLTARVALTVESGLNDVVVLPIILLATAVLGAQGAGIREVSGVGLSVLVLGPAIGALVGWIAVRSLDWIRPRTGLRRDYESLFVIGVAFAAFAAAEFVHGSGFMSAFTAGLVIAFLDLDLCDCFHEYGEATSEMFLLFAFVALGTSLIWRGLDVIRPATVAFAMVALFARSAVLWPATRAAGMAAENRRYVVWFGPRALSSLLLILLPVFAGVQGAADLFPIVALVVLGSIVLHGGMVMRWSARLGETEPSRDPILISIGEYRDLVRDRTPARVIDARSTFDYGRSDLAASGSIRINPGAAVESAAAKALPKNDWLIAYCT